MRVAHNPSLRTLTTFGVEASARLMITLDDEEDFLSLPPFDPGADFILGGGSNILFVSDVPGTVYCNRLLGKEIVRSDSSHAWIEAGAGENWHDLVRWTLEQGLSGLENLSLIPGLAGAAPIQNIGAYGVEIASVLESVTAFDLSRNTWTSFDLPQCKLAYRDSLFRSTAPGRYLVSSIRLRLDRKFTPKLAYAGLREELANMGIDNPSALDVSDAVTNLRRRKLPDPAITGNAGSFFKNPVVGEDLAEQLIGEYPEMPAWTQEKAGAKLSAAWMIEHCGFRGRRQGAAGVSSQHALVLVNYGTASGKEIFELAGQIQSAIFSTFAIRLEPEPIIVNFSSQ